MDAILHGYYLDIIKWVEKKNTRRFNNKQAPIFALVYSIKRHVVLFANASVTLRTHWIEVIDDKSNFDASARGDLSSMGDTRSLSQEHYETEFLVVLIGV